MERTPMIHKAVGVQAYTDPHGVITPTAIRWEDGRQWPIEVEIAEKWGKPSVEGTQRWRYRVRILPFGQRKWLYFDSPAWHVDVAQAQEAENR